MKLIIVLIIIFTTSSCAKMSYMISQGTGQLKLLWNGRDNNEIYEDPSIPKVYKEKLKIIEELKEYFYKYWDKKPEKIYSKTTILDDEAVSYLVILSPLDKVKAQEHCFPFVGCFPYLGFYKKSDAIEFIEARKMNFYSYMRPVYAYSTLGYFSDPVLSSFFSYSKLELAELIFHELFHTIFFIKNEVDFNENLANYIAREMAFEYYNLNSSEVNTEIKSRKIQAELSLEIVSLAKELDYILKKQTKLESINSKNQADEILNKFLSETFRPRVQKKCDDLSISDCKPLRSSWNNAKFAAIMTYEKEKNNLETIRERLGGDLKVFFKYILDTYEKYNKKKVRKKKKLSFSEYFFLNV